MGPRAGLDDMETWKVLTLQGLELRPLGRPARSQPLYWLRYISLNACFAGFSYAICLDNKDCT
jgi:hypothetical protein